MPAIPIQYIIIDIHSYRRENHGILGAVSSYFHKKGFENLSSDERIGLIDKGAMRILRAFHEDGFEAFIVGGCVRDLMMKLEPHDWDITTSALPDETIRVAKPRMESHWRRGTPLWNSYHRH